MGGRKAMTQIKKFLNSRVGQSLTSTVIGVAVLGMVGAATASMISTHRTADSALSENAEAASILDSFASEVRNTTPYHEIDDKFGSGGKTFSNGDYQVKTTVVKTCNSGTGNANCDLMNVVIDVYDKATGEKVASQTIKRVYTHFTENQNFTANAEFMLPEDTIGFAYETEGRSGTSGNSTSATSNYLAVNTRSCGYDYQPNSSGTACVACPAPSGTKQYRSGDCTIGTCPTGQKANASGDGCEQITCSGGLVLQGDSCVTPWQYTCMGGGCRTSGKGSNNAAFYYCYRHSPSQSYNQGTKIQYYRCSKTAGDRCLSECGHTVK